MAHRNHGWTRIFSGSGKWHAEPTKLTEKGDIKRDNICEICEISVWDLKLRFAQVFEDECGLAGGEVRENG